MENKRIRNLRIALVGTPEEFSLESRIFHVVCVVSMIAMAVNVPFNYLIGIPELSWLMISVMTLLCIFYYYSRFKKKLNTGIVLFSVMSNILIILNFYYNSGLDGPTLQIFILSSFLTTAIVPRRQYWFWILLNMAIVITLLTAAYNNPGKISFTYTDIKGRYLDFGYTYCVIILVVFMITTYIRTSYERSKKAVEDKAAELASLNETKNKLLSILSHDLRAPLGSIQSFLEILSEFKLAENEKMSIEKDLLAETKNTQEMLTNLLAWSKAQMDGTRIELQPVNLKKALHSTMQIQKTAATEKGIQLVNGLNGSVCIMADINMLQLVVRNLINNALKFTPAGGEVTVYSEVVNNRCQIMIKDNGTGIPYEQQKEIFNLKVKSTFGTKNEKGVGLGLVLCKEFTELQQGSIWFESVPGAGTTFYVSLETCPRSDAGNAGLKVSLAR